MTPNQGTQAGIVYVHPRMGNHSQTQFVGSLAAVAAGALREIGTSYS